MSNVVFGKSRNRSSNPQTNSGLAQTPMGPGFIFGSFRSTRDRPAREVVTAKLCGDPAPGRVVPVIAEDDDYDSRWLKKAAPIYLTFAEYRRATGEQS